jgi:hypothetical protein
MLATSVAAVGVRSKSKLVSDASLRGMSMTVLGIVFVLVSVAGLLEQCAGDAERDAERGEARPG